jgi:hypothetical protein
MDINKKRVRDALEPRPAPYFKTLSTGRALGFRKLKAGGASWVARYRTETGEQNHKPLGELSAAFDYDQAKVAAEAWFKDRDAAVRARLYLSDRPPDANAADDEAPADERVRYLARRKANYSALDLKRFTLCDGVLVPDTAEPATESMPSGEFARDVVRRAVLTLAAKQIHGSSSTGSPNYLRGLPSSRFQSLAKSRMPKSAVTNLFSAAC